MSDHSSTYLDHGATTSLRPEVAEAMAEARAEPLGNPTGSHRPAQRARRLLEESRDEVAAQLGRNPGEIIFTSGGTESANLAVFGTLDAATRQGRTAVVLSSAVEHPAVRESCRAAAQSRAVTWREIPVDGAGVLNLDALAGQLDALAEPMDGEVTLVAVMLANNETGVVQPLNRVAETVTELNPLARVFTDAVQASSFMDLAENAAGADLVSLSAHKVGGPVGVGALAVRPPADVVPHEHGGGQERERRSGTQNVIGALGLATALRLARAEREETVQRVAALRDRLAAGLLEAVPGVYRTVPPEIDVLPGHLHLCLRGVEREELLFALSERGICASGGSSCASGALEASYVLTAMGVPDSLARGAIRFTLGHDTTAADIDRALAIVPAVVAALRRDP
jgi:cysteine desulfurase